MSSPRLLNPLRTRTFRSLLIADVVSDVGAFMQTVGAVWVMVSLNAGSFYIALIQTASALPFFVFALPAGALGDIVDRRKLILLAEIWMCVIAFTLAGLSLAGRVSPMLLLALTFALSAGDALESPAFRAALPELVPKEDIAPAATLNGIEFNFARAIGPALGGVIIAISNPSTVFLINAISTLGVIAVIAGWKRHARKRVAPPETFSGATVAGLRYVRYSPPLRDLLIRSGIVTFFASGFLALLPSIAHDANPSPAAYGFLLGCFGAGAVFGALGMEKVRAHWSAEAVLSGGILIFGVSCIATGTIRYLPAIAVSVLVTGGAWIVFVSLFNVVVLTHTPDWVRSRVLAVSMLVFQGAMAAGSAAWGAVAAKAGIHAALVDTGLGTIASVGLALFFKLPDRTLDLSPWVHWRVPVVLPQNAATSDAGPILVTVEYSVDPSRQAQFIKAIIKFSHIRRRDGAYSWGIFQDLETPNRFLETFLVNSWAEHLRQHERATLADRALEERVHSLVQEEPSVRHLVNSRSKTAV
jgi:MFS family permease